MLTIHILAGTLAIVFGYIALYAPKGERLHRTIGRAFVYSMVTMALLGTLLASISGASPSINVPVGLLTTYLVVTGFTTVRPASVRSRRLDLVLVFVALAVVAAFFVFGVEALAPARPHRGAPAVMFFIF